MALGLLAALGLTGLAREDALAVCGANGSRCGRTGDLVCCSGFCKKKRGARKKFCRPAAKQGICNIEWDFCLGGADFRCGHPSCWCFRRTNGASVCADIEGYPDGLCDFEGTTCTDAACRAARGNAKAFCVQGGSACCTGKTGACVLPCSELDSA